MWYSHIAVTVAGGLADGSQHVSGIGLPGLGILICQVHGRRACTLPLEKAQIPHETRRKHWDDYAIKRACHLRVCGIF